MNLTSQVALEAARAAEEKKAGDVMVLDLRKVSLISDYFVLASGNSAVHLEAVSEGVEEALQKEGLNRRRREGTGTSGWILLDYGDVVVHLFRPVERRFYDLEGLWGDALVLARLGAPDYDTGKVMDQSKPWPEIAEEKGGITG